MSSTSFETDNANNQVVIGGMPEDESSPRLVQVNKHNRGLLTMSPTIDATLEGKEFFYAEAFTLAATTDQKDYIIQTPNTTKWAHLTYKVEGEAITEFMLWEDTKYSSTDALTSYNNNRNSTATADTALYSLTTALTTTDTGTRLIHRKSGSATNQSLSSAESEKGDEIILKQNAKYRFAIATETAGNLCNVLLHWHEHTNQA